MRSRATLPTTSGSRMRSSSFSEQRRRVDGDVADGEEQREEEGHREDAEEVGADGEQQRERLVALGGADERDARVDRRRHRAEEQEADLELERQERQLARHEREQRRDEEERDDAEERGAVRADRLEDVVGLEREAAADEDEDDADGLDDAPALDAERADGDADLRNAERYYDRERQADRQHVLVEDWKRLGPAGLHGHAVHCCGGSRCTSQRRRPSTTVPSGSRSELAQLDRTMPGVKSRSRTINMHLCTRKLTHKQMPPRSYD